MAAPTFRNEDEEAQHCLSALRDGTREARIEARERLAAIFARRGLVEEAAALYEGNLRDGVRSPDLFEQLAEMYRRLDDNQSAEAAASEAGRLRARAGRQPQRAVQSGGGPQAQAAPRSPAPATPVDAPGPASQPDPRIVPHAAANAESRIDPFPGATGASQNGFVAATPADYQGHERGAPSMPALAAQEASGRPSSGRSRAPGPVRFIALVLFAILLPVAVLALLVINPLGLYLEGRPAGPTVDIQAADVPRVPIASGMAATWYLKTGRSVSGLWATPGLELTLSPTSPAVGQSFMVTAPRSQSWGETITIVERRGQGRANQETLVPATLADLPAELPPIGTVLEGRITGDVTAPRLSESSQFNTTTDRVDVAVQLVVVSQLDLWFDRFVHSISMFFDEDRWLLVTIGALLTWCVVAGCAALLFRARPG